MLLFSTSSGWNTILSKMNRSDGNKATGALTCDVQQIGFRSHESADSTTLNYFITLCHYMCPQITPKKACTEYSVQAFLGVIWGHI